MSGVATLKLRGAKRHFDEMAVDLPVPPQACSPGRYPLRPPPLKRGRCTPSPISTPIRNHHFSKQPHQQFLSNIATTSTPPPPSLPNTCSSPSTSNNQNNNSNNNNNNNNINNNSTTTTTDSTVAVVSPNNNNHTSHVTTDNNNTTTTPTTSPSRQQHLKHSSPQHQQQTSSSNNNNNNNSNNLNSSHSNNNSNNNESVVVSAHELAALARHLPRRLKRVVVERLAAGQVASSERLFTLSDLKEIVNSVLGEHEAKLRDQFTLTLNERLAEQFRDFTKFNEDYVSRQLRGTDVAYLS